MGRSTDVTGSAADFLPPQRTLPALREATQHCRGCELYRNATQAVFGEGPPDAELLLLGEAPGDQEDRQGRPFVGPAGELLNRALEAAGIARRRVYITNVVKHFRWEPRGTRRLAKKPTTAQTRACRPWLDAELDLLQPRLIVCLGATAAQSLLGRDFRVGRDRGRVLRSPHLPAPILGTFHPAALLRMPTAAQREQGYADLLADLRTALAALRW